MEGTSCCCFIIPKQLLQFQSRNHPTKPTGIANSNSYQSAPGVRKTNQDLTQKTRNMAGAICICHPLQLTHHPQRKFRNGIRCSNTNDAPQVLKIVVSGATEILRLFSSFNKNMLHEVVPEQKNETYVTSIDDIITILKSDYDDAYFVTGKFTSGIYTIDCIFEDPTIRFRGRELYSRNLTLLVPFFEHPSISLHNIGKVLNGETESVMASWTLRTYLKLPWRPLIAIDGTTVYDLDDQFKIVKHAESWSVSPLEAIGQIFSPSSGRPI